MTHQEKAKKLVERFMPHSRMDMADIDNQKYHAKQCALICVDFALSIGVSPLDTKELLEIKQEINNL